MTSYKRSSFARSVINTVKDMTGKAFYLVCEPRKKMSKEGKERRENERKKKGGRVGGRKEKKSREEKEENTGCKCLVPSNT